MGRALTDNDLGTAAFLLRVPDDQEDPVRWVNGRPYLGMAVQHRGRIRHFLWPLEVDPARPPMPDGLS